MQIQYESTKKDTEKLSTENIFLLGNQARSTTIKTAQAEQGFLKDTKGYTTMYTRYLFLHYT